MSNGPDVDAAADETEEDFTLTLDVVWRQRIEHWVAELHNRLYRVLGEVTLEILEHESTFIPGALPAYGFRPAPTGLAWGSYGSHSWFRGRVVVPMEAAGERLAFRPDVGMNGPGAPHLEVDDMMRPEDNPGSSGECLVFVDGRAAGSVDRGRSEVTLTHKAQPGDEVEIHLEAAAGYGDTTYYNDLAGTLATNLAHLREQGFVQPVVGRSTFGIWDELTYQLLMDVETLLSLRDTLDEESVRQADIDDALRDMSLIVDFEQPPAAMTASISDARERLRPVLASKNGPSAPVVHLIGHSHLDVVWRWPVAETIRKHARTLSNQLEIAREYPEHRFLLCQAFLAQLTKTHHPELYEELKAAVLAGNAVPEGGVWVEGDTFIPSGESVIRQFVHGKRFFRDEYGVDSVLAWLPDTFGFSGQLPQIMRGCGMKYFATQKLNWLKGGGDPFPYTEWTWRGIDGTSIPAYKIDEYKGSNLPGAVLENWARRSQKGEIRTKFRNYGLGDGGGGTRREDLEYFRRSQDLEGAPRLVMSNVLDFFEGLPDSSAMRDAEYVGELYIADQRGTYTSQAATKWANRRAESALRTRETWGAIAGVLAGHAYDHEAADGDWKTVLVNQFHDSVTGASIKLVHDEATASYQQVIETSTQETHRALVEITTPAPRACTAFNSLSWEREELIPLPKSFSGAQDTDGLPLPAQRVDGRLHGLVKVPSVGAITIYDSDRPHTPENLLTVTTSRLENEHLRIDLDESGQIAAIHETATGRQWAAGPCNAFRMYQDIPFRNDAWNIDSTYRAKEIPLDAATEITVVDSGPLLGRVRVTRKLHDSRLEQDIVLRAGAAQVEFHTRVDWAERHKLLKVGFPLDLHTDELISETQFGHVRRPTHGSRQFDRDRFEVPQQRWSALAEGGRGAALLNDSKYGIGCHGTDLELTLLKSPVAPDPEADQGIHEFTYALLLWDGPFVDSPVVRRGYELNEPVVVHDGAKAENASFADVDAENVVIETIKPADDGSGDMVLRLYEAKHMTVDAIVRLSVAIRRAWLADMAEAKVDELLPGENDVALTFRPFEIKTVRISPLLTT